MISDYLQCNDCNNYIAVYTILGGCAYYLLHEYQLVQKPNM